MDAVDGLGLVLLLGLEDELLEDGVVAGDDGDGEDLAGAAVGVALACAADAEPVAAVVDRVGRVGGRLEDDAGADLAGDAVAIPRFIKRYEIRRIPLDRGRGALDRA